MSTKRVFIKTFGCAVNQSDSEVMAGLLFERGYDVQSEYGSESNHSNHPSGIDAVIINTCTVKNLAESKFFKELRYWKTKDVKIVVAGCIPQADKSLLACELKDVSVIGTRKVFDIVSALESTLGGKIIHDLGDSGSHPDFKKRMRKNKMIEIIPILEGCMGNCSYCKTKFARGDLSSYPKEKIIDQFRSALADGCKEFWITSQDNGCYGLDIYKAEKYLLPDLLSDLLSIDGEFRIRLGMCNPNHVLRMKEKLAKIFNHPKMFKFLHIPLQSGSDKVLRDMRRGYTKSQFVSLVNFFRFNVNDITISTDVIVGYPDESEGEFEETLDLIRKGTFDVLNISRFWARKGTSAYEQKQVQSKIAVSRCKLAKEEFDRLSLEKNKSLIGSSCVCMADDLTDRGDIIARDDSYRLFVIKGTHDIALGSFLRLSVVDCDRYKFIGISI